VSEVLIAQTFLRSASDLDGSDRARAFDFLTKFYEDPSSKGRNLEAIRTAKGNLFSARITKGLRAVVHRDGDRYTLLYAGQHDDAYDWAGRRRLEIHPETRPRARNSTRRRRRRPKRPDSSRRATSATPTCEAWAFRRSGSRRCGSSRTRTSSSALR